MLKRLRQARHMTQMELAKRARVGQAYVSHLEVGTRRNPSLAVRKRLAKVLGVTVAELGE